jgi:hypothetical protein
MKKFGRLDLVIEAEEIADDVVKYSITDINTNTLISVAYNTLDVNSILHYSLHWDDNE